MKQQDFKNKSVKIFIKKRYGINNKRANQICAQNNFNPLLKTNKLSIKELKNLETFFDKKIDFIYGIDLRKEKKNFLNSLKNKKNYRGIRLRKNLPVRGQRTHTNSKTQKKTKYF